MEIQRQIVGTWFIVAYENRMAYKISCTSCFLTIKFNNCTSAEQSENRCFTDECCGLTECGESFDLQKKQKRPWKPAKGGGYFKKSCLARGVFIINFLYLFYNEIIKPEL